MIDLLQIEFMPICHVKVILLISECTSMTPAKFAQKLTYANSVRKITSMSVEFFSHAGRVCFICSRWFYLFLKERCFLHKRRIEMRFSRCSFQKFAGFTYY